MLGERIKASGQSNFPAGPARSGADPEAHIRQWGPCAAKPVLDVHRGLTPCRWFLYGFIPVATIGYTVAGTPEVGGSATCFGVLGSTSWNAGMCMVHATFLGSCSHPNPSLAGRLQFQSIGTFRLLILIGCSLSGIQKLCCLQADLEIGGLCPPDTPRWTDLNR